MASSSDPAVTGVSGGKEAYVVNAMFQCMMVIGTFVRNLQFMVSH